MVKKKKASQKTSSKGPVWNLGLLYKSPEDPQIEKDMQDIEKRCQVFSETYNTPTKKYLEDEQELKKILDDFEELEPHLDCKPLMYFLYLADMDGSNKKAGAAIQLLSARITTAKNKITFLYTSIGKIPSNLQTKFLNSSLLSRHRVLLSRIFNDSKYLLTEPEEKILNLKNLPACQMWVTSNERRLSQLFITYKGKKMPIPSAKNLINSTRNKKDRYLISDLMSRELKTMAFFSEAELNAIYTDKKIEDELRGYKEPYEDTFRAYRNDPAVVLQLVKTVTESFPIAHRFFKIKAKLLGLKKLRYADREVVVGNISKKFTFDESVTILKKVFGELNPEYAQILEDMVKKGQIDAHPRMGKKGGGYCWGTYLNPTFILLNHVDDMNSYSTLAHEMGHAYHSHFSKIQGPILSGYSTSLAETASTLFEAIGEEAIFETLSEKEKITVLHDRINNAITSIVRQIAGFDFELALHNAVREKGFISKEEIVELHNKHMKAYLGPLFEFTEDDGYFFVLWSHLRYGFYLYTYSYGQLVSSALLRRYKQDKKFWKNIETFLSAGGKASPEEILKEIGIDVTKPDFWKEGLKEVEDDIVKLEKLVMKKK